MTTAADDSAVEDAFEAILAGRPAPQGQAGLAAFTEAVRTSATRPGRPDAALAELLATGLLTDQSDPSVRTARSAGSPPARRPSRVRTRRRTAMILPALLAKFLSAGAVAQAATGAGVVVVAFTGVGAVGALPAAAQDSFSTVVAAITPLTPPTSEETSEETSEKPAGDAVAEETLAEDGGTVEDGTAEEVVEPQPTEGEQFDVAAWAVAGPKGYDSHGAWVAASAENAGLKAALKAKGVSFGAVVSGWANGKGVDPDVLAALGVESEEPATEEPVEVAPVAPVVEPTDGGSGSATVVTEPGTRGNSGKAPAGAGKAQEQAKGSAKGSAKGDGGGNGRGNG